jgi:hypothetical protein
MFNIFDVVSFHKDVFIGRIDVNVSLFDIISCSNVLLKRFNLFLSIEKLLLSNAVGTRLHLNATETLWRSNAA